MLVAWLVVRPFEEKKSQKTLHPIHYTTFWHQFLFFVVVIHAQLTDIQKRNSREPGKLQIFIPLCILVQLPTLCVCTPF